MLIERFRVWGNYLLDSFAPSQSDLESRRGFLKDASLASLAVFLGLAIPNCAFYDPYISPPEEFSIKKFDRWFKKNKLYNKNNPNLKRPHITNLGFKYNILHGWTPGITYIVPRGTEMVAIAPGEVIIVEDLAYTGRAGGMMVVVGHPRANSLMSSYYAHLDKVYVEEGQKLKRGDPIGNVTEYFHIAKLMLREYRDWVDPDNYGVNHSYMDYGNGPLRGDEECISNPNVVERRLFKQKDIVVDFDKFRIGRNNDYWLVTRRHKEIGHGTCMWSNVEKFRFLESLYQTNPKLFPNLAKDQFESMKKEFYENQPIILTLPLVKGGMKKYQ